MKWIALTGGIASGKSTVTLRLRTLGFAVLDADAISREVTAPGGPALPQIFTVFEGVQAPDGSLNRQALGALVFGHEEQRRKLEAIIHPFVRARVAEEKERLRKKGTKVAFYDVPLLYEQGQEDHFDAVILIAAPEESQLKWLMQRNSLDEEQARARLRSQLPLAEKEKRTKYIIRNTRDLEFLEKEVDRVLRELKIRSPAAD